jgi:hypothetical protein
LLAGLTAQLGEIHQVMFPLPDDTTQRHLAPPPLIRSRHADLWHALSTDERTRVLLVAGPTAGYLAPAVEGGATTIAAMPDPRQAIAPGVSAWRSILGAFPELDEVPEEAGSEEERDRWRNRIRAATSQIELVRATDLAGITRRVATGVGLGPKAAARAATAAAPADAHGDGNGSPHRDKPAHWLDELIYSLTSPPDRQRPQQRRRRKAGTPPRSGGSPRKKQRARKRRQA